MLHLYSPDVQAALDELLREPLASVNRFNFHHKLANDDWRYSLEAAVRLVDAYGGRREIRPGEGSTRGDSMFERDLEVLWWRIEQGSWVMPQLVVVALVIDPSFCARAGGVLDARVTLRSNAVAITARDREDAVAHANSVARGDGKTVASLIAALRIAGKPVSVEGDSDRARTLRRLLAGDVDESELIVQHWHRSLLESFVVRGKNL